MLILLTAYIVVGAVAGLLAGLLGIGGGLVIVPMLDFCLTRQGIAHEFVMHLALGTSMATIIFTSGSSAWSHHKRRAVHWRVFKMITPGILFGTFFGAFMASKIPANYLKGFFVVFLYYVSLQMLSGRNPKPSRDLPGEAGMIGTGAGIGVVSSLLGIGGGTLSVPFMVWCNLTVYQAIATSAAIGIPLALAGTAGYITNGWNAAGLPGYTVGYIYLPALVGIVCTSVLTAPLGVRLAHSLPVLRLKKIFALLLILVGTRMLISLFA
jgi:uncharacterized membrane protein YfcA